MRTNTIKAIPLAFTNGIANATINVPFLVNEIRVICLTAVMPANNTSRQVIITSNLLGEKPVEIFTSFYSAL